jgi:hypothetical protein
MRLIDWLLTGYQSRVAKQAIQLSNKHQIDFGGGKAIKVHTTKRKPSTWLSAMILHLYIHCYRDVNIFLYFTNVRRYDATHAVQLNMLIPRLRLCGIFDTMQFKHSSMSVTDS